ncbi:hypothetical protein HF086_000251 [Spodoptera exigua]|uniref:Helicase C-terminal domain-containing protein n=1 Tax=Spodoptera exigua TaxID=7107 RepID=A0A922MDM7_SPOEX|nr:hypothetical protein HF086_000251 [Spodoptera exigua]
MCNKVDMRPQVKCQEEGAILVFLPGWSEIKMTRQLLEEHYGQSSLHMILPVHSRLSTTDQAKMFATPSPGIRKIVLATNVAETSITIPDVVYVIDSGAHKENRIRDGTGTIPLVQTVLDCKSYAPNEKIASFLSQLPEPPSDKSIRFAVNDLLELEIREIKRSYSPTSDYGALYWIQEEFDRISQEGGRESSDKYCEKYGLRGDRLAQAESLLKLREMLWKTFKYHIERDIQTLDFNDNEITSKFKVRLVKTIGRVLVEAHRQYIEGKSMFDEIGDVENR